MPLTGIDDAWQSRLPQGWTQLPDGSYGPSSNLPDWLKQLIPSPGASTPYGPGGAPSYGAGPGGAYVPGGGVTGYQGVTPGAPSMGFPAQGGPQVMPPQNSTIPPNKSVGPFTGGASTENAPGGGSAWDPRSWFRANPGATFQQGQPMGDVAAGGGAASFNPMSVMGGGNPAWRAALAAAGVLSPTPADTGELKPSQAIGFHSGHPDAGQTPYDPLSSVRVNPIYAPAVPPSRPSDAPPGTPSDTPRPTPYPPRRPKNLGGAAAASSPSSNPRFGLYQPQVPGSGQGGPLSRSPIYTTLNLFGGKS